MFTIPVTIKLIKKNPCATLLGFYPAIL